MDVWSKQKCKGINPTWWCWSKFIIPGICIVLTSNWGFYFISFAWKQFENYASELKQGEVSEWRQGPDRRDGFPLPPATPETQSAAPRHLGPARRRPPALTPAGADDPAAAGRRGRGGSAPRTSPRGPTPAAFSRPPRPRRPRLPERGIPPPAAPSAPSSAPDAGFRKRGPAGTAPLSPASEQRRGEFSTLEGRSGGPCFQLGRRGWPGWLKQSPGGGAPGSSGRTSGHRRAWEAGVPAPAPPPSPAGRGSSQAGPAGHPPGLAGRGRPGSGRRVT